MRLINTGVGELSDRLTILSLKILYNGHKETAHWVAERVAILDKLAQRSLVLPAWADCFSELGAVNAAIWRGEDDLRTYRGHRRKPPNPNAIVPIIDAVAEIAFSLQEWNDRRHELIAQINKVTGDHAGEEKVTRE